MTTSTACWRRHPVFAYLALAYGLSWGAILIVMGASGFDLKDLKSLDTALIFVAMLLGPSVGGLFMLARLEGRAGLRELASSLFRWRVGGIWYAVALLTMPMVLLAVLWPLGAMLDPAYAPRFQWPLFAVGLLTGSFEEIGWTGFVTPRLLARKRVFMAGLSLGVVWAPWHVMVDFRQNFTTMGIVWPQEFVVFYLAALTAYRVLMTWLDANTRSLLLAVLMHASYTGWLVVLYPATSFRQGLLWQAAFALALWLMVAVVMTRFVHRERADSPLPRMIEVRGPA
jgi:membrane protease YdiL (CAAX protease family)